MQPITQDQINQDLFAWQNLSRGYHGGRFDSQEICVFSENNESTVLELSLREYTSDQNDYFGAAESRWRIVIYIIDAVSIEYKVEMFVEVAIGYHDCEHAKEFCEYILASYLTHQNLSRLPYVNFEVDDV